MNVRLDKFDPSLGLDRGAGKLKELLWIICRTFFFQSPLPWPRAIKRALLRLFGAKIGKGVVIKPRVTIHFPWKLEIGDHSWLGEEVFILNFEPCRIGKHCCISQRAFLCGGNHDFRAEDFRYRNGPITIEDESWVGAQCFVGPGVTVRHQAVLKVGAVAVSDQPQAMICGGNPSGPVAPRWRKA